MPHLLRLMGLWVLSAWVPALAPGDDEGAILADVAAFLQIADVEARARLVERIRSNPAYDAGRVSEYLHRGRSWDRLEPGQQTIPVQPSGEPALQVTLRIPKAYSPTLKYPLIYSLHCGGCDAQSSVRFAERLLGDRVEEYVVAAPYQHHGAPDFRPYQTPTVLRAVKKLVHIDSDRIFVTGYSAGACAAWALALLQPDEFAAVIPVAGSLYVGEQTYDYLPNLANSYVLGVWGALDAAPGWEGDKASGIADANHRLQAKLQKLDLPVVLHEYAGRGHSGVDPPKPLLDRALDRRRVQYPARVDHHFQHAVQARAYWLERCVLEGEHWPAIPSTIDRRPDEHEDDAIVRALAGQHGELHGQIDGQTIRVTTRNVDTVAVWLGDRTIEWRKPVRLVVNGTVAFDSTLEPDLFVCLGQAARTMDFDRLRWAGLIVRGAAPAELVTGSTVFRRPAP